MFPLAIWLFLRKFEHEGPIVWTACIVVTISDIWLISKRVDSLISILQMALLRNVGFINSGMDLRYPYEHLLILVITEYLRTWELRLLLVAWRGCLARLAY